MQLRDSYPEIRSRGAEVVAIGTGDLRYAAAVVAEEGLPFPVLVDDDGAAAEAAAVPDRGMLGVVTPTGWRGSVAALRAGHRVHRRGARPTQLGATFVVGPSSVLSYAHLDADQADHAPLREVIAALPAAQS